MLEFANKGYKIAIKDIKFAKKSEKWHIFAKYLANNLEYSQICFIFAVQKQKLANNFYNYGRKEF